MLRRFLPRFDRDLIRVFKRLLPKKGMIALAGLFMMGSAASSSVIALLLGKLTDLGFYEQQQWVILAAPVGLIGVSVVFGACSVLCDCLMASVSQSVLVDLRTEYFTKLMKWPAEVYHAQSTGLVSSKFINEANLALSGATASVIVLVRDTLQILGLLGLLFWQNWQLTLATFLIGPLIVMSLKAISKRVRAIVRRSQASIAQMISRVEESYGAERMVKVSGTYDFEEERFDGINRRVMHTTLKGMQTQSLATPVTQMISMTGVAFIVAAALFEAQQGLLTIGEFITFLSALLLIKAPLQHLAGLNGTFAGISAAASSLFETMDIAEESDLGTRTIGRAKGELVFEGVGLTYPEQSVPALQNISFRVGAGEHVALVGPSGSGKSTLVSLVPRFWNPTQGRILLDGIDIRDLTLESLRSQIAVVSQEIVLFDDTIRANIIYGSPDATDEAVRHALDAAALTDFVESLPEGLETRVGEEGGLLSGGQKQRVSIARAVLKDAPVLILDEATSALDSENETIVKEALERLTRGRTTLTVAHRFSTIEHADRILVLSKGEIVEAGTHEALMAKEGLYARLYRLQYPDTNSTQRTAP